MEPEPEKDFGCYTAESLSELYRTNPELFTELADEAIRQACIGRTPEQTVKRRQMQWTIDGQLRRAKTPLGRMHIMENIFYSQVYGEDGQLARLISGCTDFIRSASGKSPSGKDRELHLESVLKRER
jgi:hypothetical protein